MNVTSKYVLTITTNLILGVSKLRYMECHLFFTNAIHKELKIGMVKLNACNNLIIRVIIAYDDCNESYFKKDDDRDNNTNDKDMTG